MQSPDFPGCSIPKHRGMRSGFVGKVGHQMRTRISWKQTRKAKVLVFELAKRREDSPMTRSACRDLIRWSHPSTLRAWGRRNDSIVTLQICGTVAMFPADAGLRRAAGYSGRFHPGSVSCSSTLVFRLLPIERR